MWFLAIASREIQERYLQLSFHYEDGHFLNSLHAFLWFRAWKVFSLSLSLAHTHTRVIVFFYYCKCTLELYQQQMHPPEMLALFYTGMNYSESEQNPYFSLRWLMALSVWWIDAAFHQDLKLLNIYSYSLLNYRLILLSQANSLSCKGCICCFAKAFLISQLVN